MVIINIKQREREREMPDKEAIFYERSLSTLYTGVSAIAQSVERTTPGETIVGSIPAVVARSLLVGSVLV